MFLSFSQHKHESKVVGAEAAKMFFLYSVTSKKNFLNSNPLRFALHNISFNSHR